MFDPPEAQPNEMKRFGYPEIQWKDDRELLTPKAVERLLGRKDFAELVVAGIQNTNNAERHSKYQRQIEYGFLGFRNYIELKNIDYSLTELYTGEEERIVFSAMEDFRYSLPDTDLNVLGLIFHAHPIVGASTRRLLRAFFGREDVEEWQDSHLFSPTDFKSFYNNASEENAGLIGALGIPASDPVKARLLLISLRTLDAFKSFDYERVVQNSINYMQVPGKDPYDAYREAGLNVALLDVDLARETPLREDQIKQAALTLSTSE